MSGAFQSSAFQTDAAVTAQYPAPAGGVGRAKARRKRYVFPDGTRHDLSRGELESALEVMLRREPQEIEAPKPRKAPVVKKHDRAIVDAVPNYPTLRDLFMAQQQIEAAQILRQVAQRLSDEQDEEDVEMILLWQ